MNKLSTKITISKTRKTIPDHSHNEGKSNENKTATKLVDFKISKDVEPQFRGNEQI